MFITPVLYIVLGLSLGVGITLIYLQEKFVRERRKLVAFAAAEKAKAQEMLKELDTKWEQKTAESVRENEDTRLQIAALEEAAQISAKKITELQESIVAQNERTGEAGANAATDELKRALQEKEEELAGLAKEKNELLEIITEARQEISNLHGEISFLKGEIKNLEAKNKKVGQDEDYFVMTPGKHIIPGSVARALMAKKK